MENKLCEVHFEISWEDKEGPVRILFILRLFVIESSTRTFHATVLPLKVGLTLCDCLTKKSDFHCYFRME